MAEVLKPAPGMFDRSVASYTCTAALLMSLQPILVTASKNPHGGFDYSVPSSTMLSEGLKLVISGVLLGASILRGQVGAVLNEDSLAEFFSYMLPAAIYFVNNNCIFFILQAVDPTTFQLLSQMKTIFTGLLFRIFLKRRLTAVQYLALVTLACGTACSQLPSGKHGFRESQSANPLVGGLLSVLSSLLSALGGIYNERLLKGRPTASIHWQNIQMYVWGVGFNAIAAWQKDGVSMARNGLLHGFDHSAWIVVVCNALNGLAISAVLKYADNIARVYAHAIAMMVTMAVSTQLFHAPITPQLLLAVVLVATSTMQYNLPKEWLESMDTSERMWHDMKDRLPASHHRRQLSHEETDSLVKSLRDNTSEPDEGENIVPLSPIVSAPIRDLHGHRV
ncbi:cmp-sialic acid transporter 4-like protein [Chrysochromulina tobinii]|uniref:Cmp-sialic acid transporter 4-like protein n=1 Tax=Chrysochromulina tobinii TaxID=1460289 RepID=A0A0M0JKN4_9EUKA|nr:cmp-sialic acid transporter 4-like protein [Chrysochromulina tobinii]|eukprot:KOO27146.1 cmp-sialic acid transporter 4-like protein [Chrysochromulina sp. CCMP291]